MIRLAPIALLAACTGSGGKAGSADTAPPTSVPTTGTTASGATSSPVVTSLGPVDTTVGGPCTGLTQPGEYAGPTQIRCIDVQCVDTHWTWIVLTDGWTRGGTIYVHTDTGQDEEHDIGSAGYAPTGNWWDRLLRDLDASSYLHSVSTGLDCSTDGPANTTAAIEVWDWATDTLVSCAAFGQDPAFYTAQPRFSACQTWTW